MANNYTLFSESLDRITPEERTWIESQLDVDAWDPDSPPEWDAPLEDEFLGFEWEVQTIEGGPALWIYAEEAGYLDHVGAFVQAFLAKFRPDDCFGLTFAATCSRPRLGEFSGGGLFVTKYGYEIFDAYTWVEGRIEQFKGRTSVVGGPGEVEDGPDNGLKPSDPADGA